MNAPSARAQEHLEPQRWKSMRLRSSARRDVLIDAAVALINSGNVENISMDAVAERAGVSRPLVYKHFANRDELLVEVYRRESAALHDELAAQVTAARGVEEMYRSLVSGSLRAAAERGRLFAVLRSAGAWNREIRSDQRTRDRATVKAFSIRAAREYGLDRPTATSAAAVLLGAIDSVLARWHANPKPENIPLLEDIYMGMVEGVYTSLMARAE